MKSDDLWLLLRERFRAWTGNVMSVSSRESALEVLAARCKHWHLPASRYLEYVDRRAEERQILIERLLIGTTWFMREPDAILGLANQFKKRAQEGGPNRVAIWSVACATGEEPYSLAMAFLDAGLEPVILATDLSHAARAMAAAGVYPADRIDELPHRWRQRFFHRRGTGQVEVSRELRGVVTFLPINLAASARPPGGWGSFDVIVCRNVLLYFDRNDATRTLRELAELTRDNGFILLSAAEHPLAWAVREIGWERSEEAPWLRRRREVSRVGMLPLPPLPLRPRASGERAPPTVSAPAPAPAPTSLLRTRLTEMQAAARAGKTDLALAVGRRLSEEFPLEPGVHLNLGLLLKGAGRIGDATAALRKARFLFGDESWLAPYALGVCLESTGEFREALEAFRHACAILHWKGPSGQLDPDENEPMLASTVYEACRQRIAKAEQQRAKRGSVTARS